MVKKLTGKTIGRRATLRQLLSICGILKGDYGAGIFFVSGKQTSLSIVLGNHGGLQYSVCRSMGFGTVLLIC